MSEMQAFLLYAAYLSPSFFFLFLLIWYKAAKAKRAFETERQRVEEERQNMSAEDKLFEKAASYPVSRDYATYGA